MNAKRMVSVVSIGVIIGFIVGFIIFLNSIIANQYIWYKMFRLVAFGLQKSLNKWVLLSIIISFALFIFVTLFTFAVKLVWKLFLSNIIEVHIRDKNKARNILLTCVVCSVFFFYNRWAINHYLLTDKFYFINLLGNVGILLLAIFLGWVLMRMKWDTLSNLAKYNRRIGCALIVILLLLNLSIFVDSKINVPKGPNVILIIVDTLRADHVSCYGYSRNTMPNIDRLSLDSILFKNAISAAPWTSPSMGSVFTSQYPAVLGFESEAVKIGNKFLTLAEIFKENNYKTKGIISSTSVSSTLGFNQGFDSYDEENAKCAGHISSPSVTEKAISFIKKYKNDKFFLFLYYFDPHHSYILHEDYNYYPDYNGPFHSGQHIYKLREKAPEMSANDIKYIKALYDSEISFTDEYMGEFLGKLKEIGLYNNTLIIFTADHGEEFLERGDYWIGHNKKLYQEQIHIPLIIKLAGGNKQEIIDEYVGLIDLMPTTIDYVDLRIPNEYKYEGEIIDINDKEELKSRTIISETKNSASLQSVIWRGWKFIYDPEINSKKLFNLKRDPAESKNVIIDSEKVLKEMEIILQKWNNDVKLKKLHVKTEQANFTDEQKKYLRSLGYLQ